MKKNNEVTLEQLLNELFTLVVKEEKKNMKNTDERVKIPTKHECVGNKLDILESRVTELEENNSRMLNIIDKQGDIIDELIEIARIHTNGFASIYDAFNGANCDCDCGCDCDCDAGEEEGVEEGLEAGKWYLAWDGEKKSDAVVVSFVGYDDDGDLLFAYSAKDIKNKNYYSFENYSLVTEDMLGAKGKKNQVGKLYYVYDEDKNDGVIMVACTSKEFCFSTSEMNDVTARQEFEHVEEVKPSTLGK